MRLHNEELHNFYFSPDVIRKIRRRKMRSIGHVAHMMEVINTCSILIENLKARLSLGAFGVGGRIILILNQLLGIGVCSVS
jgi:hypothetical protein